MASKRSNTNILDVAAMYQAGAAGASAKGSTKQDKSGQIPSFLKTIGNYALSFYMKSIDLQKSARLSENKLFIQCRVTATHLKNDIIENHIKHEVTYLWLPRLPQERLVVRFDRPYRIETHTSSK